jgi:hypothetical protein
VRRRIEVWLANAESDDVATFRPQAHNAAVEGDRRRGLYALDALREDDGHGEFPRTQCDGYLRRFR